MQINSGYSGSHKKPQLVAGCSSLAKSATRCTAIDNPHYFVLK